MISQKLLPKLCSHCKVIDESASALLNHKVFRAPQDQDLNLKKVCCRNCEQTGYAGRVLLWEAYSPEFSEHKLQLLSFQKSAFQALKNGELSYQQVKEFAIST